MPAGLFSAVLGGRFTMADKRAFEIDRHHICRFDRDGYHDGGRSGGRSRREQRQRRNISNWETRNISNWETFVISSREWTMQCASATVTVAFAASVWVAGQRVNQLGRAPFSGAA
jgi:hypothetical protein